MKHSITIVDRLLDNDQHQAHLTVSVGDRQLHFVGIGASVEDAERDVERVVAGAIEDLEQIGEIRRRTGGFDWRGAAHGFAGGKP